MKMWNGYRCALVSAGVAVLAGSAQAERVFAVTSDNTLISFSSARPNNLFTGVAISGLAQNERIRGIDFRPRNNGLYALGSFSNLYLIDPTTGNASRVGGGLGVTLNGSSFGFDFNPTIDRIRVVSDADQNLVLNPDTGAGTVVTSLFYNAGDANNGRNPNVTASAYSNNVDGATTSQLFGIDTGLDVLVRQANSAGTLDTVGSLGVDLTDVTGFDISGLSGTAFAGVLDSALSRSTFWRIDLTTGAATQIGEIGGGALITALAVATPEQVPAPGAAAAVLAGVIAGSRRRR